MMEAKENEIQISGSALDWHLRLFEKSLPGKATFTRVNEMLSPCMGQQCLAIGGDPAMHHHIRQRGGDWTSADWSPASLTLLRSVAGEKAFALTDHRLPFEDKVFDQVVVFGGMAAMENDQAFIVECHRVLKERGELVVNVDRHKPWGWIPPLRRILTGQEEGLEKVRTGYTESALFEILKDGFDEDAVVTYSRFFTHLADLLARFLAGYVVARAGAENREAKGGETGDALPSSVYARLDRFFTWTYPLFWVVAKLDWLIFFTRGYLMVAHARRRIWKPRRVPRLHDGRSIAEATLRTKIGSASSY